jgi:putative tryptophan/tyrosine transport system substrate-binding protein
MYRRKFLLMLGVGVTAIPSKAEPTRTRKLGALNFRSLRPAVIQVLRDALHERGYVEGKNLVIDYRFGAPDELQTLAAELVRTDVELISCGASAPLRAVMAATRDIPVVAIDLETDPVASGYAVNLARPGGNMTGFFLDLPEFSAKRLELLKEAIPQVRRVVALWDPVLDRAPVTSLEAAADALGLRLLLKAVENEVSLLDAFKASSEVKAGAVIVMQSPRLDLLRSKILDLAEERRIPVFALFADFAADGGLLSYGPNVDDMTAQTVDYIDRIFKGAKPGELPIQRPTRFDLVLNLRTARRLGLTVPTSVQTRADVVIQ